MDIDCVCRFEEKHSGSRIAANDGEPRTIVLLSPKRSAPTDLGRGEPKTHLSLTVVYPRASIGIQAGRKSRS